MTGDDREKAARDRPDGGGASRKERLAAELRANLKRRRVKSRSGGAGGNATDNRDESE